MGTRSAIAPAPNEPFRGRYVHWDGYPLGVGRNIWRIVQRDGLDTARRVLTTEHTEWSSLDPDGDLGDTHRRDYVLVPGYGHSYPDSSDEWSTGEEWNYTLADEGLRIQTVWHDREFFVRWDGPEPNWKAMEETV